MVTNVTDLRGRWNLASLVALFVHHAGKDPRYEVGDAAVIKIALLISPFSSSSDARISIFLVQNVIEVPVMLLKISQRWFHVTLLWLLIPRWPLTVGTLPCCCVVSVFDYSPEIVFFDRI